MIIDMYFAALYRSYYPANYGGEYAVKNVLLRKQNEEKIGVFKQMPEEAKCIFILNINQKKEFDKMVEEFKLKDLIQFQLERPITNRIHKESGRRIYIVVMGKQPLTEEEYGNTIKRTEACTAQALWFYQCRTPCRF